MMAGEEEVNCGVVRSAGFWVEGGTIAPKARVGCSTTPERGSGHRIALTRTKPPRGVGLECPHPAGRPSTPS